MCMKSRLAVVVGVFTILASACLVEGKPTEGYLPRFSRRAKPAERSRIPLVVHFPDLPGVNELPATFGVPFPRGALKSAGNVRLVDGSGHVLGCAVERTATWEHRNGDVRWILIDAPIRKNTSYFLEYGTAVRPVMTKTALAVNDAADRVTIKTGVLELVLSKGHSALISEAKLQGRVVLPAGRQKRMSITDEAGSVIETSDRPEDYRITVEQRGPFHAIVKVTGWYRRPNGEKMMQYIARIHAYANQPFVRVVHTFVINYDTDKVHLKNICIPFVLDSQKDAHAAFGLAGKRRGRQHMPSGFLLQDNYNHAGLFGPSARRIADCERAEGWFDVSTRGAGLTVGLRHMWQEYPKDLEAAGDEMRVHLWPLHGKKPLDFSASVTLGPKRYKQWSRIWHGTLYKGGLDRYDQAMGLAKTNELVLSFHTGAVPTETAISHCATLEKPLVVCADPDWMCKSDVFGRLCSKKSSGRPDVERKIELGFESFGQRRRDREGYGMIHYGDVHGKGPNKGWRHWASRFYGFPLLPWIMFVRTAEPKYLVFAMDNAKHVMDIDMCHVTNLKSGDYGRRCPKRPGKRRGGRYGGDGGIIHYAGHLYDIGCDSHVDQWTYAYYLTGYRRAWDILHEEGEYYVWIDKRKESATFRRYAHRMTGGAMRILISLYRATWDERYLKLAHRMADFCYKSQDKDGTIRYDDVYMNPGLFTYYQMTADKRMLDLFLRCSRKHAGLTDPLTDTRFYLFYGPAMAYFATGDTSYLPRSVGWLGDFLASPDGSGGYMKLTVQLNYLPYLLEALATCDKPVEPMPSPTATDGEILLSRDDNARFHVKVCWACYDRRYLGGVGFEEWPEYVRRNKITAAVVVRDANLREVARRDINLSEPVIKRRRRRDYARSGEIALAVPAGPPGVYRLAIETNRPAPMKLFLLETSLKKAVYRTSPEYVAFGSRYHFFVPKGRRKFKMQVRAQILRTMLQVRVFDPEGRVVKPWQTRVTSKPLMDYAAIEWDVPAGADGKVWSFTTVPNDRLAGLYVKLDGPPWLATSADGFFDPKVKLPPRSTLKKPDPSAPPAGKFLSAPAGKALTISRGADKGAGRYERINASQGTIEFRLRPGWASDDIRDRHLMRCGKMRIYRRGSIGTYLYVGNRGKQSGFVLAPGHWHHMALVWSTADKGTTSFRLYVNGVSLGGPSAAGDWTGKDIRIGSTVPLDIGNLRVSAAARYKKNFDLRPLGKPDKQTLVQLDFDGKLPSFAKIR